MNFKKQNKDFIGLSSWSRKAIGSIAAFSLAFLAACSDDSSSNSSNDIPDIEEMSKADVASLLQIKTA